jgi:hypothetical protein
MDNNVPYSEFKKKWMSPTKEDLKHPEALWKYFIRGWTPDAPFVDKDTRVIAFGSCFAKEVTKRLKAKGVNVFTVESVKIPVVFAYSAFNTTFAMQQQLEWVFEGRKPDDSVWWDNVAKKKISCIEGQRYESREAVKLADLFILTLGLSEVSYNKETGSVFWYAIPATAYDPVVHRKRISTVQENYDSLNSIWTILKKNNPNAKVVFSLSPVPLQASFRSTSSVSSNVTSKAILRVAVDEFVRDHPENLNKDLFYWPSYEIAKEYFDNCYKDDNRHVSDEAVDVIMDQFMRYFVKGGL